MLVATALLWAAVAAQQPDSAARAAVVARLRTVSDSLHSLGAQTAAFGRDLTTASDQLVLARALPLRNACQGAVPALDSLAALLAARPLGAGTAAAQRDVQAELRRLRRALLNCQRDWTPRPGAAADTLRAWGPFRIAELERVVRRYEETAGRLRRRLEHAGTAATAR